jgi:hypothetical protein
LGPLPVSAPVGPKEVSVPKGEQRVDLRIGDQNDRSSVASIATVRSASRDELLPPERDAPVSPIAPNDGNACFVDEHG